MAAIEMKRRSAESLSRLVRRANWTGERHRSVATTAGESSGGFANDSVVLAERRAQFVSATSKGASMV